MESVTTRCRTAWSKFSELLPLLTCRSLTLRTRGNIFTTYVRSVLTYGSECWSLRKDERNRLLRNERAMVRWVCGVKPGVEVDTAALYNRLAIPHLDAALRYSRLRWYGHVTRSQSWIQRCQTLDVAGRASAGRPRKTWNDSVKEDLRACRLNSDLTWNRDAWRESIRVTIRQSNPL